MLLNLYHASLHTIMYLLASYPFAKTLKEIPLQGQVIPALLHLRRAACRLRHGPLPLQVDNHKGTMTDPCQPLTKFMCYERTGLPSWSQLVESARFICRLFSQIAFRPGVFKAESNVQSEAPRAPNRAAEAPAANWPQAVTVKQAQVLAACCLSL